MRPTTLNAVHQLQAEGNFPYDKSRPPVDMLAEIWWRQKVTGGFRKSDPVCPKCFVKKAKSGGCNC